jgi:hypothetical protein
VSIFITVSQAATVARMAGERGELLQLHQVVGDPDLFVTSEGAKEPDTRIAPDGTGKPIEGGAKASD